MLEENQKSNKSSEGLVSMIVNKEQVLSFLPHRDPFLFVDGVEKVEFPHLELKEGELASKDQLVGSVVTAVFEVKEDLKVLEGHFPGNPILPGVVQVEMMAQASSFMLTRLYEDPFASGRTIDAALLSVSNAKFRKPIVPGMRLTIKATCTRFRGNMVSHDGQIYHDGQLMSEASVMCRIGLSEDKVQVLN